MSDDPRDEAQRIKRCLAAIANSVHRVCGDLAAFGPYALDRARTGGGPPLEQRLASTLASLLALQSELQSWRKDYVDAQLQRLGIDRHTRGLKINIGSGRYRLESWLNIDIYPADLALDVRWGLGLPDGSAQWAVMLHVLEHLYYPGEAERALEEVHRVLAPGGVVRIVVPDIEKCLRAYVDADTVFFDARKRTWTRSDAQTRLEAFLKYAGAGPSPGYFLSSHKFGYDFETLGRLLQRTGFTTIERSDYMKSRHEALRVDHASKVAGGMFDDQHFSLFVEASG